MSDELVTVHACLDVVGHADPWIACAGDRRGGGVVTASFSRYWADVCADGSIEGRALLLSVVAHVVALEKSPEDGAAELVGFDSDRYSVAVHWIDPDGQLTLCVRQRRRDDDDSQALEGAGEQLVISLLEVASEQASAMLAQR